jgi:5,10-methylenetetrahydromethanopterin reductase
MEISAIFPPSLDTPDHIALAEELGYERAYMYDVPVTYADTGITLAMAAERTSRIRLGVAVVTPHLRHLAVNAALVAHLATIAPGRFDVGIGSGFTSAAYIGRKPAKWADVERYTQNMRTLLAGGEVEVDGTVVALMHPPRSGIRFPIEVPIWIGAHGPKAYECATRLNAAGIITVPMHGDTNVTYKGPSQVMFYCTILEDGETLESPRVVEAAGPGAALALHLGQQGPLAGTPEAAGYEAAIAEFDESRRHLERNRGHLLEPNAIDRRFLNPTVISRGTATGTAAEVGGILGYLESTGAAGVLYQPGGPDIERELRAFYAAAQARPDLPAPAAQAL